MVSARRIRLVTDAFAVGLLGGMLPVLLLVAAGWQSRPASTQVFALGALALGVGTLGWSGSVMVGRGIEARKSHLGKNRGWTEAKSRRAMARLSGLGAGTMAGSALLDVVLASS